MNWSLFLPWMACWAATTMACLGVGYWCGYQFGRDKAEDEETGL